MKRTVVGALFLLSVGCASQAPGPTRPDWNVLPGAVLEAFCMKLNAEGVATDGAPVAIVKTTQPLVSTSSLRSLSAAYFKAKGRADAVSEAMATTEAVPLTIGGTCAWQPIDMIDQDRDINTMIAEISPVIPNPFAKNEAGMFARLSVGGKNAQLYWIPLGYRGGRWGLGTVMPIE